MSNAPISAEAKIALFKDWYTNHETFRVLAVRYGTCPQRASAVIDELWPRRHELCPKEKVKC